MKGTHYSLCTAVIFGALICFSFNEGSPSPKSDVLVNGSFAEDTVLIQRGKYLVGIMGCQDCHSPKRLGPQGPEVIPELHLSGYPADRPVGKAVPEALANGWTLFGADATSTLGPWGISFAANITSDDTGIGTWSYEQFKIALTQGKSKGLQNARPLLPPMPWINYISMADEDIKAVFAYLKSTPPVSNVVPAPISPDKLK